LLIATLPPVHHEELLEGIIAHPAVAAVRYNTGIDSPYSPKETLARALKHAWRHKKPLYVDLKGRQLRITEWATLPFGPILLNHRIKVSLPARILFRGDDACEIKKVVGGRKIYVEPLPKYPVGRGQSVNILADNLEIRENLTEKDYGYIESAIAFGINKFMLSFVESWEYVKEVEKALGIRKRELVLKIESEAGVELVRQAGRRQLKRYRLMAARDDLMIQIGGLNMLDTLALIAKKDSEAICASRLLLGFEQGGGAAMADISDLRLMENLGYRHFMFSDGLSRKCFREAAEFWQKYQAAYPK